MLSMDTISSPQEGARNYNGKVPTSFTDFLQPIGMLAFVTATFYSINLVVLPELQENHYLLAVFFSVSINGSMWLAFWGMYKAITVDAGKVPEHLSTPKDESNSNTQSTTSNTTTTINSQGIEKTKSGQIRYCKYCNKTKPDRCHHCSRCGRCVLKMDHHCKWLMTCIGFRNYKFFYVAISWGCFGIVTSGFCMLPYAWNIFWNIPSAERTNVHYFLIANMLACIPSGLSSLTLVAIHFQLITRNLTTLEYMEKGRGRSSEVNVFDVGTTANWEQVFGENSSFFTWLLPIDRTSAKLNGVTWPTKGNSKETV